MDKYMRRPSTETSFIFTTLSSLSIMLVLFGCSTSEPLTLDENDATPKYLDKYEVKPAKHTACECSEYCLPKDSFNTSESYESGWVLGGGGPIAKPDTQPDPSGNCVVFYSQLATSTDKCGIDESKHYAVARPGDTSDTDPQWAETCTLSNNITQYLEDEYLNNNLANSPNTVTADNCPPGNPLLDKESEVTWGIQPGSDEYKQAYYNICGTGCCGCYAQYGPIPAVLSQVQFCSNNFGYLAENQAGPDGNTRTQYCILNSSGQYDNAACYNQCYYYGVGTSDKNGMPRPGGIVPDAGCLAAQFPLVANSPTLAYPAKGDKKTYLSSGIGYGNVLSPQPDQCNSCRVWRSYSYKRNICPTNLSLTTYKYNGASCSAGSGTTGTLERVWIIQNKNPVGDSPDAPVINADATPAPDNTNGDVYFTAYVPCISDNNITALPMTFFLNKNFISTNNNSGAGSLEYQLCSDPYTKKPLSAFNSQLTQQVACKKESGRNCDGTDLPQCPTKDSDWSTESTKFQTQSFYLAYNNWKQKFGSDPTASEAIRVLTPPENLCDATIDGADTCILGCTATTTTENCTAANGKCTRTDYSCDLPKPSLGTRSGFYVGTPKTPDS